MKKLLLFCIVYFAFINTALSQNIDTVLQKKEGYFLAVRPVESDGSQASRIFSVGDKIAVKLRDNKIIKGKISKLSQSFITIDNRDEIDVNNIKWIKKTKLTAGRSIAAGLVAIAGVAVLAAGTSSSMGLSKTTLYGTLGVGLISTGIVILISRPKFRIQGDDKLIFKEPIN